jgi:hypothetical protein
MVIKVFKKIAGGFKSLYHEGKAVYRLRNSKDLRFKDFLAYESHVTKFKNSEIYEKLSSKEIESVKSTIKSFKKIGVLFVMQIPPIIGYLPVFVALGFPRQLLTKHFWDPEQVRKFAEMDHEERYKASSELISYLGWNDLNDTNLEDFLDRRKNRFISNLTQKAPFPYDLTPGFEKKYYLCLLLQITGILYNPKLIFFIPSSHLKQMLNSHVNEIMNDDVMIRKEEEEEKRKNDGVPGIANLLSLEEIQHVNIVRGIFPSKADFNENARLHKTVWKENNFVQSLEKWIEEQEGEQKKVDFHFVEKKKEGVSFQEMFLFRLAWNTLQHNPPSSSSRLQK